MKKTEDKKEAKGPGGDLLKPFQDHLHDHLREAAYYRWLERGMPEGQGLEDWYEVENRWRDNIVPSRND
jgi:hypothetical protein